MEIWSSCGSASIVLFCRGEDMPTFCSGPGVQMGGGMETAPAARPAGQAAGAGSGGVALPAGRAAGARGGYPPTPE
eukprot:3252868-Rhodomonas_salina.1